MIAKRYHLPIGVVPVKPIRIVRLGFLTIKVFSSNLPYGRFGVIIPKAVVLKATARNILKRAAFDAFKPFINKLSERDILCVVSKGAPNTRSAMLNETSAVLSKLL